MKTMFVYDDTGKIYHWAQGDFVEPVGLPCLIVEDYDYEVRPIERIDVSVEPHAPVYGMTKAEAEIEAMTLEEYKNVRQEENKAALATFLKENPILWQDGMYYGVTQDDQDEMNLDLSTYQFKQSIGQTDWKLEWHSAKSACRVFTVEEFTGLLNAIVNFVYPYRQLEMQYKEAIYRATTKEEITAIELIYSLPEVEDETAT